MRKLLVSIMSFYKNRWRLDLDILPEQQAIIHLLLSFTATSRKILYESNKLVNYINTL